MCKMSRYDLKMLKKRLRLRQLLMLEERREKQEAEMYKKLQRSR